MEYVYYKGRDGRNYRAFKSEYGFTKQIGYVLEAWDNGYRHHNIFRTEKRFENYKRLLTPIGKPNIVICMKDDNEIIYLANLCNDLIVFKDDFLFEKHPFTNRTFPTGNWELDMAYATCINIEISEYDAIVRVLRRDDGRVFKI